MELNHPHGQTTVITLATTPDGRQGWHGSTTVAPDWDQIGTRREPRLLTEMVKLTRLTVGRLNHSGRLQPS